jgi:hypothetical protein
MSRFHVKFNLKVEGKEQYRVEISHRFTALENVDTEVDSNRAWETVRENVGFEVLTAVVMKNTVF